MSNYPESADIFTDKAPNDGIGSSDPNVAYDAIEASQGLIGTLGKPQSWSTTLITLLRKYREGMEIELDGANLYVRKGEAMLENTDGTKLACRRNATDVLLSSANIDTGALAINTYYIYASAGAAMTTAPILFSLNMNAPSGIGTAPYRKLGYFWNEAAGALAVTYISGGDAPIKRSMGFDSGAMAWYIGTAYTVTHNLNSTALIIQPYFRGTDPSVTWKVGSYLEEPDDNIAWEGFSIYDVTATTISFRIDTKICYNGNDGVRVDLTAGQARLVVLAIN